MPSKVSTQRSVGLLKNCHQPTTTACHNFCSCQACDSAQHILNRHFSKSVQHQALSQAMLRGCLSATRHLLDGTDSHSLGTYPLEHLREESRVAVRTPSLAGRVASAEFPPTYMFEPNEN